MICLLKCVRFASGPLCGVKNGKKIGKKLSIAQNAVRVTGIRLARSKRRDTHDQCSGTREQYLEVPAQDLCRDDVNFMLFRDDVNFVLCRDDVGVTCYVLRVTFYVLRFTFYRDNGGFRIVRMTSFCFMTVKQRFITNQPQLGIREVDRIQICTLFQ